MKSSASELGLSVNFGLTGEYGELSFNDFILRQAIVIFCHYFTSCTS